MDEMDELELHRRDADAAFHAADEAIDEESFVVAVVVGRADPSNPNSMSVQVRVEECLPARLVAQLLKQLSEQMAEKAVVQDVETAFGGPT